MSDVTDLLAAVADVRSGSGLSRARSSVTALQTLMRMSPEDKRAVAVMVAERAAPHLVERIEAGTGQDLSKEQVETVLQLFQKLDAEDLDELRATVTDAERRGAALRDVTSAAAASAAAASGLDELVPPAEREVTEPDDDAAGDEAPADTDEQRGPDEPTEEAPDHDDEAEAEAELEAAKAQVDAELAELEAEAERMKAEARRAQAAAEAEIAAMGSGSDDGAAVPTTRPAERALDDPLFDDLPDVGLPDELEDEPVDDEETDGAPDRRTDRSGTRAAAGPLRDALVAVGSGSAALGLLRAAIDELADRDDEELLDLVRLVPDGWARRRAVEAFVAADHLHGEDAADAVRILGAPGDRRFVAGTLLEAGHATPTQLRGTVDDRTLDRLARRTR